MNRMVTWLIMILVATGLAASNQDRLPDLLPEDDTIRTVEIDLEDSVIRWRGTKLFRTGSHEGTVNLSDGYLLFKGDRLVGGKCTADMKSIYVTDIPLSDPVPRRNLTTHLHSDFETDRFPVAVFEISKVEYGGSHPLSITGKMTIKGMTRELVMPIVVGEDGKTYSTEFIIDRSDFNIGENGSWLEKKLVDAEFVLQVSIFSR
jgi:polyisoprenoid-binding protein YceI